MPRRRFFKPLSFFGGFFPKLWGEDEARVPSSEEENLTLSEDASSITVQVSLPGLKTEEIHTDIKKGILSILGKTSSLSDSHSYQVPLPKSTDTTQKPTKEFKDGVLTIVFNKKIKGGQE